MPTMAELFSVQHGERSLFHIQHAAGLSSCGWCTVLIWASSGQDSGGLVPQCLLQLLCGVESHRVPLRSTPGLRG